MKTKDLDRIHSLGFRVEMEWREFFSIDYVIGSDTITILYCEYNEGRGATYEDVVEVCCDIFYGWYGQHRDLIRGLALDSPEWDAILPGSVSKSVRRILNLDKLV